MDGVLGECYSNLTNVMPCYQYKPSYIFVSNYSHKATASEESYISIKITAVEIDTYVLERWINTHDTQARGFPANANTF